MNGQIRTELDALIDRVENRDPSDNGVDRDCLRMFPDLVRRLRAAENWQAREVPSKMPEQSTAGKMLEDWWNEDPEMRYAEILCGDVLRFCVRLYQISIDSESPDGTDQISAAEDGTLEAAIASAIRGAQPCRDARKALEGGNG